MQRVCLKPTANSNAIFKIEVREMKFHRQKERKDDKQRYDLFTQGM